LYHTGRAYSNILDILWSIVIVAIELSLFFDFDFEIAIAIRRAGAPRPRRGARGWRVVRLRRVVLLLGLRVGRSGLGARVEGRGGEGPGLVRELLRARARVRALEESAFVAQLGAYRDSCF
jgi:hypothetical protein